MLLQSRKSPRKRKTETVWIGVSSCLYELPPMLSSMVLGFVKWYSWLFSLDYPIAPFWRNMASWHSEKKPGGTRSGFEAVSGDTTFLNMQGALGLQNWEIIHEDSSFFRLWILKQNLLSTS